MLFAWHCFLRWSVGSQVLAAYILHEALGLYPFLCRRVALPPRGGKSWDAGYLNNWMPVSRGYFCAPSRWMSWSNDTGGASFDFIGVRGLQSRQMGALPFQHYKRQLTVISERTQHRHCCVRELLRRTENISHTIYAIHIPYHTISNNPSYQKTPPETWDENKHESRSSPTLQNQSLVGKPNVFKLLSTKLGFLLTRVSTIVPIDAEEFFRKTFPCLTRGSASFDLGGDAILTV